VKETFTKEKAFKEFEDKKKWELVGFSNAMRATGSPLTADKSLIGRAVRIRLPLSIYKLMW
jgi:hypothetical protein